MKINERTHKSGKIKIQVLQRKKEKKGKGRKDTKQLNNTWGERKFNKNKKYANSRHQAKMQHFEIGEEKTI